MAMIRKNRLLRDKKIRTGVSAFLAVGLIIVGVWLLSGTDREESDQVTLPAAPVIQTCSVDTFSKTVARGETIEFDVIADMSSQPDRYYARIGNLPMDLSGWADDYDGQGDGQARISIKADRSAQTTSYNIPIIYETEISGQRTEFSRCLLNLKVY